jgi:hypothetical protein
VCRHHEQGDNERVYLDITVSRESALCRDAAYRGGFVLFALGGRLSSLVDAQTAHSITTQGNRKQT